MATAGKRLKFVLAGTLSRANNEMAKWQTCQVRRRQRNTPKWPLNLIASADIAHTPRWTLAFPVVVFVFILVSFWLALGLRVALNMH